MYWSAWLVLAIWVFMTITGWIDTSSNTYLPSTILIVGLAIVMALKKEKD